MPWMVRLPFKKFAEDVQMSNCRGKNMNAISVIVMVKSTKNVNCAQLAAIHDRIAQVALRCYVNNRFYN